MSGSDGPGGGGGLTGTESCEDLRLARLLEAGEPAVVATLAVGDVMIVQLNPGPPEVVAVLTAGGDLAGGISPTVQLVNCLRRRFPFEATVVSKAGGAVHLEVRAAS